MANSPEIEIIEGSARMTTALAIRRRQYLADETKDVSDLALLFAAQTTDHRTCFIRDCQYDHCFSCDEVAEAARWFDAEMDRAGVTRDARQLPYPARGKLIEEEAQPTAPQVDDEQ